MPTTPPKIVYHWVADTMKLTCSSDRCLTLVALGGRRLDALVNTAALVARCIICQGREHREHGEPVR